MTLVAAAVVPSAPLLVPELAGGSADLDAQLREEVLATVDWLVRQPAGRLAVVGGAPATGACTGTWDWSGFGVRVRGETDSEPLPLSLALGRWLLHRCGAPVAELVGVAATESPAACARLGRQLASSPVRLLVVGDGSGCRTEKAPGHLDARAESYDHSVEAALAAADCEALLRLDEDLAAELLVAGRASWQVLAGAAAGQRLSAEVRSAQAPYGVCYFVARWSAQLL